MSITVAKPKQVKANERRATSTDSPTARRLRDAAMIEFARFGYEGGRVDRIAIRAKVNRQLLYYHFGSKAALYAVVLERAYGEFLKEDYDWNQVVEELDAEAALRHLAGVLFTPSESLKHLYRIISEANMRGAKHLPSESGIQKSFGRLISIIATILERGSATGTFRDDVDPREFYVSMLGALGTRVTNAATISSSLGIDLISKEGAYRSHQHGLDLLIAGLRVARGAAAASLPTMGEANLN